MIGEVGSAASQPSSVYSVAATPSTDQTLKTAGTSSGQRGNRKNGNKTGSTITYVPGQRIIKQYPITEGELKEIFGIGILSSICFTLGTSVIAFGINLYKDGVLAQGLDERTIDSIRWAFWVCFGFGGLLLIAGAAAFIKNNFLIQEIKKQTNFDV
jgi:hypothetical protein